MFYWKHQILLNNKYEFDPSIKEKSNKQTDKKKQKKTSENKLITKNPTKF